MKYTATLPKAVPKLVQLCRKHNSFPSPINPEGLLLVRIGSKSLHLVQLYQLVFCSAGAKITPILRLGGGAVNAQHPLIPEPKPEVCGG